MSSTSQDSLQEQANSLYAALARTATRSLALYFSRPVRLFRPAKGTSVLLPISLATLTGLLSKWVADIEEPSPASWPITVAPVSVMASEARRGQHLASVSAHWCLTYLRSSWSSPSTSSLL